MDILLIEDNVEFAELIKAFLEQEGFCLCHKPSGEEALVWLANHSVKLILLDIMLDGIDGFVVCQAVRQNGSIPILMLSARSTKEDQLMGFELGADDYLEKPIDMDILVAKIRVLLQRTYGVAHKAQWIMSGNLRIDMEARNVQIANQVFALNGKEYELLLLFIQNPNKTLRKDFIFRKIWGEDSESENQTLTVHVQMLRTKIEDNPRNPTRIKTVWGVGYRYEEV